MAAEIISLNKYRKDKARAKKPQHAAANRAKSGRSKVSRREQDDKAQRSEQALDGKRLNDFEDNGGEPA